MSEANFDPPTRPAHPPVRASQWLRQSLGEERIAQLSADGHPLTLLTLTPDVTLLPDWMDAPSTCSDPDNPLGGLPWSAVPNNLLDHFFFFFPERDGEGREGSELKAQTGILSLSLLMPDVSQVNLIPSYLH